ncbi:MAG: VOC family protein [Thiobacillus sp.]
METDDFDDFYQHLRKHGVEFMEEPRHEEYGKVVVFKDMFGNKWDLIGKRQQE